MAMDGEAYFEKEFFKARYKFLKDLGTKGLTKRTTTERNEETGKYQTVWIIEYEAEEVPETPLVN